MLHNLCKKNKSDLVCTLTVFLSKQELVYLAVIFSMGKQFLKLDVAIKKLQTVQEQKLLRR